MKANALNTNVNSNPGICRCSGKSHSIYKCQMFANKSVKDKKRFILDKELCYGCLRKDTIPRIARKKQLVKYARNVIQHHFTNTVLRQQSHILIPSKQKKEHFPFPVVLTVEMVRVHHC